MKKLSPEQWEARGEAYSEAADHLRMDWAEARVELSQRAAVIKVIERLAKASFRRGQALEIR